jgi:hypothetical protein
MLSPFPFEPAGSTMSMGEFLATKAMSVAVMPSLPTIMMGRERRRGLAKSTNTLTTSALAPLSTSMLTACT